MSTATKQSPPASQPAPVRASRMKLSGVVQGRQRKPYRVLLFGVEGVGKSSFGASAPAPIFLGTEDGSSHLDVARFPAPPGGLELPDVFDALRELGGEKHEYRTLVVDTLDWLEPVIWRHICEREKAQSIEEVGGGYGKGYTAAMDVWRSFIAAVERMQAATGMHVVLLAHSQIKKFANPTGEDFDRYQLKMNEKASGLAKEWVDYVLFANFETYAKKDERTKRVRGVSTGARLIYTQRSAGWDAKFRGEPGAVPDEIPLSWADFDEVAHGATADTSALRAEVERKAKELGGETEKKVLEALAKAGSNPQALTLINNRANALLSAKEG